MSPPVCGSCRAVSGPAEGRLKCSESGGERKPDDGAPEPTCECPSQVGRRAVLRLPTVRRVQLLARPDSGPHCYIGAASRGPRGPWSGLVLRLQPLFPRGSLMRLGHWLASAIMAALGSGIVAAPALGQDPAQDRAAVLAVVRRLFDGMRSGDSAAVRATFHPKALLATAATRQGKSQVQIDTVDAFV